MIKRAALALITLLASNAAMAECRVQCPVTSENVGQYFDADKFSWSDPTDQVHMLIGFGGAMLISTALNKHTTLKPWQSALIGSLAMGLIGTTKEVMFDTYTSRTDIKTYWAGALAGGLSFTVLNF